MSKLKEIFQNIFSIKNDMQKDGAYKVVTILWVKFKFKKKSRFIALLRYRLMKRKTKKVVYTCITNDYDDIRDIGIYRYFDSNWDYVCFTDNKANIKRKQIGIWQIRPLVCSDFDNTRNNRFHKLNPHIVLPEYDESVYIDSNIEILTSAYFDMVNNTEKDLIIPFHHTRNCIFEEKERVLELDYDKSDVVNKQFEIIEKSDFPRNFGLFENNLIYRKHKKQEIIKIMEEWWAFVKNHSMRDQLSLMFVLWKNGRNPKDIGITNLRQDRKNFLLLPHKKSHVTCKA